MDDLPLVNADAPCGLGGEGGFLHWLGCMAGYFFSKPTILYHNKQGCGCAVEGGSWEVSVCRWRSSCRKLSGIEHQITSCLWALPFDRLPYWFSKWLSGKESACNAGDAHSIPGSGRSPGEGNGSPLQYSCLGNPMDRGAWWATVHGVGLQRVIHK